MNGKTAVTIEVPKTKQIADALAVAYNEETAEVAQVDPSKLWSDRIEVLKGALEPKHGRQWIFAFGGKDGLKEQTAESAKEFLKANKKRFVEASTEFNQKAGIGSEDSKLCMIRLLAPKIRGLMIESKLAQLPDFELVTGDMDTKGKVDLIHTPSDSMIQLKSGKGSRKWDSFDTGKADVFAAYWLDENSPTCAIAFTEIGQEVNGNKDDMLDPAYLRAKKEAQKPKEIGGFKFGEKA